MAGGINHEHWAHELPVFCEVERLTIAHSLRAAVVRSMAEMGDVAATELSYTHHLFFAAYRLRLPSVRALPKIPAGCFALGLSLHTQPDRHHSTLLREYDQPLISSPRS